MALTPPSPTTPEQRLLAAIVFTDVAGFSARIQDEESNTLRLLERDFLVMSEFTAELSGRVIKSTGDGLLLHFASAVQAMTWALKTQRHFAEQARGKSRTEFLQHRVGVHLGDVFVTADDVMGDGVNIAARVQTEAPAGGICISQTVYDVVKNKLELHVVRLEPRKLKNIRENVQMYHVLLEPPARPLVPPSPTPGFRPAPPPPPPSGRRRLGAVIGVLLALGLGAGWIVRTHFEQERELARSQAAQAALGALLTQKSDAAGASVPATAATGQATAAAGIADAETVDFLRITSDRPARSGTTSTTDNAVLRQAEESVGTLHGWLKTQLQRYTRDRPLGVRPLQASGSPLTVFTGGENQLWFAEGGAMRKRDWETLRPEVQAAIILSALRDSPADPAREVIRGAEAFAYLHGLPAMAEALRGERRGRAVR